MNSFVKSFIFFILQISLFQIRNSFALSLSKLRIKSCNPAEPNQFPWQASITTQYKNKTELNYCSGTIISNEWILTAAHCIDGSINITLGFNSLEWHKPQLKSGIKNFIIHPAYKARTHRNDIALIQLQNSLNFTESVKSLILPLRDQSDLSFDGVKATISGWGVILNNQTENNNNNINITNQTNPLQWAELVVISNPVCAQYYGSIVTDAIVCAAGTQGENVCGSDFGGPLIIKDNRGWVLIGIASFTQGCDSDNRPIGFSRITSFLDWISKESGINLP